MKEIQKIIRLILSNKTNTEIINELGILFKVVGRIHLISPKFEEIENIGLVIDENKIRSVNIKFREPISFQNVIKEFTSNYSSLQSL